MMKCSGKKLISVVISVVKTGDKNKYGSNRNNFKMDVTTFWIAFKITYAFQSIRLAWQLCAQKTLNFSKHIGIIYKVLLDDNLAGLDISWSLYFSTSFVWAQGCKEKEIIPPMLHLSRCRHSPWGEASWHWSDYCKSVANLITASLMHRFQCDKRPLRGPLPHSCAVSANWSCNLLATLVSFTRAWPTVTETAALVHRSSLQIAHCLNALLTVYFLFLSH